MTTTRQVSIAEGDAGTDQTAAEMADLIRNGALTPRVRDVATAIAANGRDDLSQLLMLRDWVARHFQFMRDPASGELLHDTDFMLSRIQRDGVMRADCDDAAILGGALACAIGANVSLILVALDPGADGAPKPYSHVWASASPPVACIDPNTGKQVWIEFDVTRPAQIDPLTLIQRAKAVPVC